MEFPRQASICQEGLRTPSQWQQEAESFTSPANPPPRLNARHNAFNALFIPAAEESEAIPRTGINSSTPDRAEAYKIYLPTRAALFPPGNRPYSTPDNCITSHCAPTLSPIVGSPPLPPRVDRLHFLPVTEVSLPLQISFSSFLCEFFPKARFKASVQ